MLDVKVSRKVSWRAYGSIELTSHELAHLNVLASADPAMNAAHIMALIATERRKLNFIKSPPTALPHAQVHISARQIAPPLRSRQTAKNSHRSVQNTSVGQAPGGLLSCVSYAIPIRGAVP